MALLWRRSLHSKAIALLFAFVLVLTAATAHAAGTVHYNIGELTLGVDIPSDLVVFTQDMPPDDPKAAQLGIPGASLSDYNAKNNIYLTAIPQSIRYQVILFVRDSIAPGASDLGELSDGELAGIQEQLREEYGRSDIDVRKTELYAASQAKFVTLYYSMPKDGKTMDLVQYMTVKNGVTISFVLNTFSGNVTPAMEAQLKQIVDSTNFSEQPPPRESTEVSPTYWDKHSRVSFVVPGGWEEADLADEPDYTLAKYQNAIGNAMRYGYLDFYAQMAEMGLQGVNRADVDNGYFSRDEVARMYETGGTKVDGVSLETVGDTEYFVIGYTRRTAADGAAADVPMQSYARFVNGYLYEFTCSGRQSEPVAYDFGVLLSTIKYYPLTEDSVPAAVPGQTPAPADSVPGQTPAPTAAPQSRSSFFAGFPEKARALLSRADELPAAIRGAMALEADAPDATVLGLIFVSLFFAFILCGLPIIVYRYVVRGRPLRTGRAFLVAFLYGILLLSGAALIALKNGDLTPAAAVFFWACVDFRVLAGSRKSRRNRKKRSQRNRDSRRRT